MKPSHFTSFPLSSVLGNHESEKIARNIMIILKRTGNEFRELTWEEYSTERIKDGGFHASEKKYFDNVIGYCGSAESAAKFSFTWKAIYNQLKSETHVA